jgi:hypothetical protein
VQSLPSPADSFCYLDWQIPAQEKMRCRQTRIAWLGMEMRLAAAVAIIQAWHSVTRW